MYLASNASGVDGRRQFTYYFTWIALFLFTCRILIDMLGMLFFYGLSKIEQREPDGLCPKFHLKKGLLIEDIDMIFYLGHCRDSY